VQEGLAASPELAALDQAVAVRQRVLEAADRALYVPTVALRGDVAGDLARGGRGADSPAPAGDVSWTLGLSASFPLYSGGGKLAARARVRREVEQLHLERAALADCLEQRIRSAAHVAGASYAGIRLSDDAATSARSNLELVEDAYGRGAVSILELLDAHNAAFLAEEGAASATYGFLVDLMAVERAIGRFYLLADDAAREAWFARADAFYRRSTSAGSR
ncbi:MAG: TolC family protein, partial [Gemmatimonadota bacterium]